MEDKLEIPQNAFTRVAGSEDRLPEDSQVFKDALEYRRIQLGEGEPASAEQLVALGDPHPLSQVVPESQASVASPNVIVEADSTDALPEGVAGRIISKNLFEYTPTATSDSEPLSEPKKAAKWGENPDMHPRREVIVGEVKTNE